MDFQSEKESWEGYSERLEHFFTSANIVEDDKKAFTLIHQNGPSFYTLLKELSFPHNPTLLSYTDIMDLLKRHYVGVKNIYNERKLFYRATMRPYESASEWHRRLKSLSMSCDFGNHLEEILVDKFVTGFEGKVLHRLYEQDEHLNLQQALEIAQRYETEADEGEDKCRNRQQKNKPNMQTVQEKGQGKQKQQSTQHRQPNRQQQQQQYQQEQQQQQQQNNRQMQLKQQQQHERQMQFQQQQQSQQRQQQVQKNIPTCNECGKKGHRANVCRIRIQREQQENSSECCVS